jgi:hypothetical protein
MERVENDDDDDDEVNDDEVNDEKLLHCCLTLTTSSGVTAKAVMTLPIDPETILTQGGDGLVYVIRSALVFSVHNIGRLDNLLLFGLNQCNFITDWLWLSIGGDCQ